MKKSIALYYVLTTVILLGSCREKYIPPVLQQNLNYLVVDGGLINGPDSTLIRLSRTKQLEENPSANGLNNAMMTVEDAAGNSVYTFTQLNNNGLYCVPGMHLDIHKKYRLRINTTDGNRYVSDDLTVVTTPPIDSVSWRKKDDGVTIYANTHDPSNSTNYYRWEYIETYDYDANYYSVIKYKPSPYPDSSFMNRRAEEQIYHCWKTVNSTQILLASSLNLKEDVISQAPVRFIPAASIELSLSYSVLLKQFALTKECFDYMQNLQRITEQAGSLFDAQPSQLTGNIHNVDLPGEPVIGFMTASSLQQQRIFITNEQVRPWRYQYYCEELKLVPMNADSLQFFFGGAVQMLIPVDEVLDPRSGQVTGIHGATPICADCQARGGTTTKPDFWQ